MYVSELRFYDFRKFKSVDGKLGLEVRFHPGPNAMVGENGSGKTTVVDAMRHALLTQNTDQYSRAISSRRSRERVMASLRLLRARLRQAAALVGDAQMALFVLIPAASYEFTKGDGIATVWLGRVHGVGYDAASVSLGK